MKMLSSIVISVTYKYFIFMCYFSNDIKLTFNLVIIRIDFHIYAFESSYFLAKKIVIPKCVL